MNNYEKIKQMSLDEMAKFCSVFQRCSYCSLGHLQEDGSTVVDMEDCQKTTCEEAIKQWLESEA